MKDGGLEVELYITFRCCYGNDCNLVEGNGFWRSLFHEEMRSKSVRTNPERILLFSFQNGLWFALKGNEI